MHVPAAAQAATAASSAYKNKKGGVKSHAAFFVLYCKGSSPVSPVMNYQAIIARPFGTKKILISRRDIRK